MNGRSFVILTNLCAYTMHGEVNGETPATRWPDRDSASYVQPCVLVSNTVTQFSCFSLVLPSSAQLPCQQLIYFLLVLFLLAAFVVPVILQNTDGSASISRTTSLDGCLTHSMSAITKRLHFQLIKVIPLFHYLVFHILQRPVQLMCKWKL